MAAMLPILNSLFPGPDNVVFADWEAEMSMKPRQNTILCQQVSGAFWHLLLSYEYARHSGYHLFIAENREEAMLAFNDLESWFGETNLDSSLRRILFFPVSYSRGFDEDSPSSANALMRAEVLNKISAGIRKAIIVTYPEALCELLPEKKVIADHSVNLRRGDSSGIEFLETFLHEFGFSRVDFVTEAGQFAVRGGIVDIFSYASDNPFRLVYDGDTLSSIRSFDIETQLSTAFLDEITILANVVTRSFESKKVTLPELLPETLRIWCRDIIFLREKMNATYEDAIKLNAFFSEKLVSGDDFYRVIIRSDLVVTKSFSEKVAFSGFDFRVAPQPSVSRDFNLLMKIIEDFVAQHYSIFITAESSKQVERLYAIIGDLAEKSCPGLAEKVKIVLLTVSEGFVDHESKMVVFTDHQIFQKYLKPAIQERFNKSTRLSLEDFFDLKPGDYVVHINHGIGRYAGLEKIEVNGQVQEAIKLLYKDNDELFVSIHSLHRISKYTGKDGNVPKVDKIGSASWQNRKAGAKKKVKDIARDLIKLYALRKSSSGFACAPDTYLQTELEASFIYEDTPDQVKATQDIKKDMEGSFPMDRLICGDVGFGKTELAVRAAFKAVTDGKQVAVLVPTTVLAYQHFRTFSERLAEFPCRIEYLNRFRDRSVQKNVIADVESGKVDILIGTHRLLSADVKFREIGLLIIDEEQKFGVGAKEKLRQMKANIDTLILTATPIPRTLQFSLMGARDISILRTPPPNRYPVQTEVKAFDAGLIRSAIEYEISRGGQVFFVHNRIQNIADVEAMLKKLVPKARIGTGHGRMKGEELEGLMLGFVEGDYDVLLSTAIIESGLDVPNANTIIINDAQNFGLSDLHQLRGRVGRSNKKAFCYILTPPLASLSEDSRKRLRAIEEFSELGAGFNIAMRDLDIRGAGNILGAEQSGFIAEIGFELYQRVLDEALLELKQEEFPELIEEGGHSLNYISDVNLETDFSLLFPDFYVPTVIERLKLYKELNEIEDEGALLKFGSQLEDRFGPMPTETLELIEAVKLKWFARKLAVERLLLKNNSLSAYFAANRANPFYKSDDFQALLTYVINHPWHCRMKESKDRLILHVDEVGSISKALALLRLIVRQPQ